RNTGGDHLEKTLFTGEQRFRALAVGDVDHGTDEFNQIARRTENRMSSAVNVSDLPTRMHDSVFNFNVSLLADCPLLDFLHLHLIVGMTPSNHSATLGRPSRGSKPRPR